MSYVSIQHVVIWHRYPPDMLENVPPKDAHIECKRLYCQEKFPYFLPPMGPGMTDRTVEILCTLHRMANKPSMWNKEFHNFGESFFNWRIADILLKLDGYNLTTVLRDIKYGDEPGWLTCPPKNYVFVQQLPPPSKEALEQEAEAVLKNLFGKSSDKNPSAVCDGCATVPIRLQHCASWAIPKGKFWQVIFDCSNRTRRIVVDPATVHYSRGAHPDGTPFVQLNLQLPAKANPEHPDNVPINGLQPPEAIYKSTTVDYTQLVSLKTFFRRWKWGRISWIDLRYGSSRS